MVSMPLRHDPFHRRNVLVWRGDWLPNMISAAGRRHAAADRNNNDDDDDDIGNS